MNLDNGDNSDSIAIQALLLDFSEAFDRMRPDFVFQACDSYDFYRTLRFINETGYA